MQCSLFFDRITSHFPMGKRDPQIFFSSQEALLVSGNTIRGLTSPDVSSRNRYDQYSVTILQVYLQNLDAITKNCRPFEYALGWNGLIMLLFQLILIKISDKNSLPVIWYMYLIIADCQRSASKKKKIAFFVLFSHGCHVLIFRDIE